MSDLREKLINPKSYDQLCIDIESRIVKLKSQNDALQSNLDIDSDKAQFYLQLKLQKSPMDQSIDELRKYLTTLEKQSEGTSAKNKSRRFRDLLNKETDRYRQIFSQILQRSSFGSERESQLGSGGGAGEKVVLPSEIVPVKTIDFNHSNSQNNEEGCLFYSFRKTPTINHEFNHTDFKNNQQLHFQANDDNDLLIQNQEDIDSIQQEAHILNRYMNDVLQEVNAQNKDLDFVQVNENQTIDNVISAKQELDKADQSQKSSRKWIYGLLLVVILLTASIVFIVLYFNHTIVF